MPRETKTTSEIEAMIFDQIKSMPNGEHVEGVSFNVGDTKSGLPLIGVGWNINPGSMRDILSKATFLGRKYALDYDVKPG